MPRGYYQDKVQKFVHKEYIVWTGICMVGNIGGQLGLWVGFSFTGLVAGILNLWYCAHGKISSNKHFGTGIKSRVQTIARILVKRPKKKTGNS